MTRLGFGYEQLKQLKPDIVYVSNCGFGQVGPYKDFKSWGPIAQAVSGMTFQSGLPDREPAGWGYSYMDHTGGYMMAISLLAALFHRAKTGEGQWVDLSCTEAGAALNGPALLDYTVNGRALRREGSPNSNRHMTPNMAPHGIYPSNEADRWVAIACRSDSEWQRLRGLIASAHADPFVNQDAVDAEIANYTSSRSRAETVAAMTAIGVPAASVARSDERIDHDPRTAEWGLWPTIQHSKHGAVRVDGLPVHLSRTDWKLERGGPLLGEDNERVLTELLGLTTEDVEQLRTDGVI